MEAGFVLGQTVSGKYGASIAWVDRGEVRPNESGWHESRVAIKLAPGGSGGVFSKRPRFPAWRCASCKRIEFSYDERVVFS